MVAWTLHTVLTATQLLEILPLCICANCLPLQAQFSKLTAAELTQHTKAMDAQVHVTVFSAVL